MRVEEALQSVNRLFLDTAPVIYYIEHHPTHFDVVNQIFDRIETGTLTAVISPVTLAECLVHPYRLGLNQLQQDYLNTIANAEHTIFQLIDAHVGQQAAALRSTYNLNLPDALQIAAALVANCEALLTNDRALQRVTELRVHSPTMDIANICNNILSSRLKKAECLVVYNPDQRYRNLCLESRQVKYPPSSKRWVVHEPLR